MAIKYGKKKHRQNYILYTMVTAVLLIVIFLAMIVNLYNNAEEEAYDDLHIQTRQIKDDITLQLLSDRENLMTMANYAANLRGDGKNYDLMFESFKPIGLIANIGILNPDNTFETKAGTINLDGKISFEEEAEKGSYISGRMEDLTNDGYSIVRTAVPIKIDGTVCGILYGVIKLNALDERYSKMADDINAQLFVYDISNGDLVIDNVHDTLGNISFLRDRKYNDGYSYEEMMASDKGFTSFVSAYRDENVYMHYSAIEEIGWEIALARYESKVFAQTKELTHVLFMVFFIMIGIIGIYIIVINVSERRINGVTESASNVRKELLETIDGEDNILGALIEVCNFTKSRSVMFFNTDGEFYHYILPQYEEMILTDDDRRFFRAELFRYASDFHNDANNNVNVLCIKSDRHMLRTNPDFYRFLKEHGISDVSLSATTNKLNQVTVLATINSERAKLARMLAEKVAACFSMALYNKNNLYKTTIAATTDSLTGVYNRVEYKNDIDAMQNEKLIDFSCIYIDVNELHVCNNKYGHTAGDQMLIYVADSLKENFSGHKIYRMGGDEFLVFCKNTALEKVEKALVSFKQSLKERKYHVAVGMSFSAENADIDPIVKEAEVRMYEAKALYYQNKEKLREKTQEKEYVQVKTGIVEIDTMISVLREKYNGIYRVALNTDRARRILMPSYLNYNENEENFSSLFSKYVSESVEPNCHRAVLSFMNYEAVKRQLESGSIPKIRYKKNNGESVILSVYKLCSDGEAVSETLWVFAKE